MRPKCDCCGRAMDRMWVYRCRGFCFRFFGDPTAHEPGWWAFCVYCHALFIDRAFDQLAARICTMNRVSHITAIHSEFKKIYSLLGEVVYGEPVVWEEGQDFSERRFPVPPEKPIMVVDFTYDEANDAPTQ